METEGDIKTDKQVYYQAAVQMLIHENSTFWNRFGVFVVANSVIITAVSFVNKDFRWVFVLAGICLCYCWAMLSIHGIVKCREYHNYAIEIEKSYLVPRSSFLARIKNERKDEPRRGQWVDRHLVPILAIGAVVIFLMVYMFYLIRIIHCN